MRLGHVPRAGMAFGCVCDSGAGVSGVEAEERVSSRSVGLGGRTSAVCRHSGEFDRQVVPSFCRGHVRFSLGDSSFPVFQCGGRLHFCLRRHAYSVLAFFKRVAIAGRNAAVYAEGEVESCRLMFQVGGSSADFGGVERYGIICQYFQVM